MTIRTIGIDLAKNVFQVHGVDERGHVVLRKQIKRDQLAVLMVTLPPCVVGMEACGRAHHWGRKFQEFGHTVRLMSPQFVKPYVKSNKNDAAGAEAICEAVTRPNMRFVLIKSVEQQAVLSMHRVRQGFVTARTAQSNQIRGLLAEFGIVLPQGISAVRNQLMGRIDQAADRLPGVFLELMRHLIDTYIEASEPRKISPFDDMPLLQLIVKTGIANAINSLPNGLKGSKEAVAETIENNVRSKIIKENLNDPAYYAKMSALLDEIIAARKANAIEYEEYLKQVAELAKRVEVGQGPDVPEPINTPGRRALFNNLGHDEALALKIDETVKHTRPDGWRGVQAKENVIKAALYGILQSVEEVERIFLIIRQQTEY